LSLLVIAVIYMMLLRYNMDIECAMRSLLPPLRPTGDFMTPLPLLREHVRLVPRTPGCYVIYVDDQPYYAGMSKISMRARLWAHATGKGSRMVRQMIQAERTMYFEYCAIDPASLVSTGRDIARAEFYFMLMHTGELLPGNRKADGISLFPDPNVQSLVQDPISGDGRTE
jgi:hypothetical protein